MSSISTKEDLRSIKTKKALYAAMFSLLKIASFKKMTIKSICEEALISRAAFYAHFYDKYDLLKHWLTEFWPEDFSYADNYEHLEKTVNSYLQENMLLLKNLVCDADNETLDIFFDFILCTIGLNVDENNNTELYAKNIVLANFYAGGIISYLLWQVENRFPPDVPPINKPFYTMFNELKGWPQN